MYVSTRDNMLLNNQTKHIAKIFYIQLFCFSDIIGFTRISVKSSPHEIVNLLNAVYRSVYSYAHQ